MEQNVGIVRTDSHVYPVHGLDDLAVDTPGNDPGLFPELFCLPGCTVGKCDFIFEAPKFIEKLTPDIGGDLLFFSSRSFDTQFGGDLLKLYFIGDIVPLCFADSGLILPSYALVINLFC